MQSGQIRVAIIGLGLWGARAHLPAFAERADVQVVALVDPRLEVLQAAGGQYGIQHLYPDAGALFAQEKDLDAVVIATPEDTHRDLTLAAVKAGAHVFCEKPIAHTVEQGREMVEVVRAHNRISKTGFLFRFSPIVQRMKELVDSGYIGQVLMFENLTLNAQFMDPGRSLHWKMQQSRARGGVFVEYGVHMIDLALWFGGPITRVVAHGVTIVPERPTAGGERARVDTDDACTWIGTYAHGGDAMFRAGWASLPVGGGGLRLYGTEGSLSWQMDATGRRSEQLLAATRDEPEPRVLLDHHPPFDARFDTGAFPLWLLGRWNARLVGSFIDDIKSGHASAPTLDDALAAQYVLAAIRRSLDEERWVEVERG